MRRYRVGEHPVYDKIFNSRKLHSRILSGGNRPAGDIHSVNLSDQDTLTSLRVELVGSIKVCYWDEGRKKQLLTLDQLRNNFLNPHYFSGDGSSHLAIIPSLFAKLAEIDDEVERRQAAHVLTGRGTGGACGTSSERYRTEASLDVRCEELKELEQRLAKFARKTRTRASKDMLRLGPVGTGRIRDNVLTVIDGQRVSLITNEDGGKILVITESKSEYCGMAVPDYHKHVVAPWSRAKNHINRKRNKLQRELHAKGLSGLFAEQWHEMRDKIMKENPEFKDLFAERFGSRPNMPSWPAGVKSYKNMLEDEE